MIESGGRFGQVTGGAHPRTWGGALLWEVGGGSESERKGMTREKTQGLFDNGFEGRGRGGDAFAPLIGAGRVQSLSRTGQNKGRTLGKETNGENAQRGCQTNHLT